jgi:hypothetical protein
MDPQTIIINNSNVQKNSGCLGGCGTVFAVLLLVGLAVQYWYISVGVLVVGIAAAAWHYFNQQQKLPARQPAVPSSLRRSPEPAAAPAAHSQSRVCAGCGAAGVDTAFCAHCGQPQSKTCAGCGITGLQSQFCPDCGSATFTPPSPV